MGTNVILDIIGSTIIGGILLLTLFRLADRATESTFNRPGDLTIQQNLTSVVKVIENDFRKVGYCAKWQKIPDPTKAIIMGDTSKITFLTDSDKDGNRDGNVDTLSYYLGPTSELIYTANPRDRFLYRVINNEAPVKISLGVTQFKLTYYDAMKNIITPPVSSNSGVFTIQIDVAVENVESYNQKYSSVFWRQIRLVARNLRNR
jgi:type II secretory pathway component PulJ